MTNKLTESYCFNNLTRPVNLIEQETLQYRKLFSAHQLEHTPDLLLRDELHLFILFRRGEDGVIQALSMYDELEKIDQIDIDKIICEYSHPDPKDILNLEKVLFEILGDYLGRFLKIGEEDHPDIALGVLRTLYPEHRALVAYVQDLTDLNRIQVNDLWEIIPTKH